RGSALRIRARPSGRVRDIPTLLIAPMLLSRRSYVKSARKRGPAGRNPSGSAAAVGLRRVGSLDLGLGLEGRVAAAGRLHVGVLEAEPGAHEAVVIVDPRSAQVREADRVDDEPHAVRFDLEVAVLRPGVEPDRVLETGAA